jgi:WD40 repeat protein
MGQAMKGDAPVKSIAFSRDGHLLAASYADYTLRLWNTGTSQPVGNAMGLESIADVTAFSPDGRTVASGGDDGTIQLWNVGDQSALEAPLRGHKALVTSLDFSPDGTKLLSAFDDHELQVWPAPEPSPEALCAKITHNMSHEQWNDWVSPEIPYAKVCPDLPEAEYSG